LLATINNRLLSGDDIPLRSPSGKAKFMKREPTERDYKKFKKRINDCVNVNTYKLWDMGYSGGKEDSDLAMLLHWRFDLLVAELVKYIDLTVITYQRHKRESYLYLESKEGYDYVVSSCWTPDKSICDYVLRLNWEESFSRSEMPTAERVEGEMPYLPGFEELINMQFLPCQRVY
jgi:hypothetical protein